MLSPNGSILLYRVDTPNQARDVYWMNLTGDRTPHPYLTTKFDEYTARFSPDGKWVAYVSNESGRHEVYVRPFPGPGGRVLVSADGGQEPTWTHDGKRIYYRTATALIAVSIDASPDGLRVTSRETVLNASAYQLNRFHPMYDIAPDGRHVVLLQNSESDPQLTVVLNWTRSLAPLLTRRQGLAEFFRR